MNQNNAVVRPRPGFALALQSLRLVDVLARLREHVVQIVADADKRETFRRETRRHARCRREIAEDDVVLAGFGDKFRGGA